MDLLWTLCWILCLSLGVRSIPLTLLYDYETSESTQLTREDDIASPEITLKVPIIYFGTSFDTIFVNSNGLLSFQTEIPNFFNTEFPLDYPVIAPFYSNVDLRAGGTVSYYETDSPSLLQRASENIRDAFSKHKSFQAKSLFVATWFGVGFYKQRNDKINTYQVAIASDGQFSFVEFLYPENGLQWIQGTGDESGLPDARAQAGFVSAEGEIYKLPGSSTEQVRNLEKWSNINLAGQFLYRIDEKKIIEPDLYNEGNNLKGTPFSCADAAIYCHVQAKCYDYSEGFCCKCKNQYYGNGKYCIKKDVPLRVNGKVNGNINEIQFNNLDLQSYIVMADGRTYTAISKIPVEISYDIQSLQILGGVIGYIFAKPIREALNGYQLTGGVFNHSATINFLNTSQQVFIKQKFVGLDVFDQLRLETNIQGNIPKIPIDTKIVVDDYQEEYTVTAPGVVLSTSTRSFKYNNENNQEIVQYFKTEQTFLYDYCRFENNSVDETWKLKVGKNFIHYESREQIIRFAMSNKITPLGDFDPCELGRAQCGPNSACVVENDSFQCICNPGYQHIYSVTNEVICADIDECQTGHHDCDINAQCSNSVGGFFCTCNPDFEGNGRNCKSIKNCQNTQCLTNAECIEISGIPTCRCISGYIDNGQYCIPEPISCHINNTCSPNGYCEFNRNASRYYCSCLPGYSGDGFECHKISTITNQTDPCGDNCDENADCTFDKDNSQYYCKCREGFDGDGYKCEPENQATTEVTLETTTDRILQVCIFGTCWCADGYEIEQGTPYCIPEERTTDQPTTTEPYNFGNGDDNARPEIQCFNETLCFCPKGFVHDPNDNSCKSYNNDGKTMGSSGINYTCNILNNCHANAQCIYSHDTQKYSCICNDGYQGDGYRCEPGIVSCTQLNNCNPHATCTYNATLGKSVCVCNEGYDGDGYHCRIIAICTSNDDCTETEECLFSSYQRYECVCKDGFTRDSQHQCVKLDGTCGGGYCVENAECLYDNEYQTYYCTCKSGYIGDGITECTLKPIGCNVLNNCGLHATCLYDETTTLYQCKCDDGFYGDGFNCYTEINCHIKPSLCHTQASCVSDANRRYICKCNDGYIGNGSFCKPTPTHEGGFLLLNQGVATLRIPFEPTKKNPGRPIQIKYFQTAVGLDIDCYEGRVYWSDVSGMAIRSSTFNGSDKNDFIIKGIGSPEGLTVDWVSRNIYWTDSTKDTVEVANLESKRRRVLFNTGLVNPRGIVVHPQRGKIFWTDWDRKNPKIEWSNADGSGREIFLQSPTVSLPNFLTIDYDLEQLCYADAGTKKIECVDIDTRKIHTIAVNCTYPFGISVTDKHIYWSDWISKKIERVEKFSLLRLPPLQVPLGGSGNKLYGLIAVPITCPTLTNVCQYYKDQCPADHICLPNGLGSKSCLCSISADDPNETPKCQL